MNLMPNYPDFASDSLKSDSGRAAARRGSPEMIIRMCGLSTARLGVESESSVGGMAKVGDQLDNQLDLEHPIL